MAWHGRVRVGGPSPRHRSRPPRHDPTAPALVAGAEGIHHEQHFQIRRLRPRPSSSWSWLESDFYREIGGPGGTLPATVAPSPTLAPSPTTTPVPTATPVTLTTSDVSNRDSVKAQQPGTYRVAAPFAVPFNVTFATEWELTGVQEGTATSPRRRGQTEPGLCDRPARGERLRGSLQSQLQEQPNLQRLKTVEGLVAAIHQHSWLDCGPDRMTPHGAAHSGKTFVMTDPTGPDPPTAMADCRPWSPSGPIGAGRYQQRTSLPR